MKGKRMLGLVIVITVMTAIPVLSENAKASSENNDNIPSYLVIVRLADGHEHLIEKTIGNGYQDDKFGVELVVHIKRYDAHSDGTGTIELYPVALAAKGVNAGSYKIKWLELKITKFSFEGLNSERTPHATDYESSLNDIHGGFMEYNLSRDSTDYLIENWINIETEITSAAIGLAVGIVTSETDPLVSFAASTLAQGAAHYIIDHTLHSFFNVRNVGTVYGGSAENPWNADPTQAHTYMMARGTASKNNNHRTAIVAGQLEWHLDDDINDRVHVVTIKASLCYAKNDGSGWYDEHTISTSATLYVAPQSMVKIITTRGNEQIYDLKILDSDPAYSNSYSLKVVHDNWYNTYTYSMPEEDSSTTERSDSSPDKIISLLNGCTFDRTDLDDTYYYYRGALPLGDYKDCYRVDFPHNLQYQTNRAHIWIYTSHDIQVKINYCGQIQTLTIRGGKSVEITKYMQSNAWAYITISKLDSQSAPHYIISAFVEYSDYNGESGGSGGGGYHPPGNPNHPPIPTGYYPTAEQNF